LFNPFTLSEYSPEAEFILTFVYVLTNKKNIICEDTNDGTKYPIFKWSPSQFFYNLKPQILNPKL